MLRHRISASDEAKRDILFRILLLMRRGVLIGSFLFFIFQRKGGCNMQYPFFGRFRSEIEDRMDDC
jgi:hypothetical protein